MSTSIRGVQPARQADNNWSRMLWKDCPWQDIGDTVEGVKFEDNFQNQPLWTAGGVATDKYRYFIDAGGTIGQSATDPLGSVDIALDTTTNDAGSIQTGNLVSFVDPAGGTQLDEIWFEAEFSIGTLTDSCFVGLMAYATPATAALITDGDILADIGCIGFSSLQATPTILNFTYKAVGETIQVPITTVETLVVDTNVRVGFHYLSNNPTAKRLTVFNDNVIEAAGVTKAAVELDPFPNGVPMALTAAIKNYTTTLGSSMNMTRWRVAMVRN